MRTALLGLAIAFLFTSCNSVAPTATPTMISTATNTPVPTVTSTVTNTPVPDAQVEDEIVNFTLDFILQEEIAATADYITNSGQPWIDAPPRANIIIYAPVTRADYVDVVTDDDHPITVWWFEDGKLELADDELAAIDRYRKLYMDNASTAPWAYGYYSFGIIAADSIAGKAEILVNAGCGYTCGHGVRYQLRRSLPGKWTITDEEPIWIS